MKHSKPKQFVKRDHYTKEDAQRILFDGVYAMGAKKAGDYEKIRAVAESEDLIDETRRDTVNRAFEKPQRQFSDEEIRSRLEFSEEECKGFYVARSAGATDSDLAKLKASDPAKYARLRTAATSYGIVPEVTVINHAHPQRTRKPNIDGKFELSAEMCAKFRLPAGYRVDADGFAHLVELRAQHESEQRRALASAQPAA